MSRDPMKSGAADDDKLVRLTRNEAFWIEVIRMVSHDADPAPTLALVQKLRLLFSPCRSSS